MCEIIKSSMGMVLYMLSECDLFPLLQNHEDDDDERMGTNSRCTPVRILGYVERIIPRLGATQFQAHFGISRQTFETLLPIIHEKLKKPTSKGRPSINSEKQLLAVLWILATPDSYRSVGERFNMGKSSLSDSFFRVVKALNKLAPSIITWPRNLMDVKQKFKRMGGIDGIIGAVDGTYIPIKAPKKDAETYVTRKCHHAVTLQAICDATLRFTDVFVGYPGSVSDTRIFCNSDIYQAICHDKRRFFPNNEFLVGDKAYPVLNFLMPPYVNRGNLTAAQLYFNTKVSQTRQTIERSFALLFGCFRRLKYLDMNSFHFIPATVLAACVLHNLCLDTEDWYLEQYVEEGMPNVEGNDDDREINVRVNDIHNFEQNNGFGLRDCLCQQLFANRNGR